MLERCWKASIASKYLYVTVCSLPNTLVCILNGIKFMDNTTVETSITLSLDQTNSVISLLKWFYVLASWCGPVDLWAIWSVSKLVCRPVDLWASWSLGELVCGQVGLWASWSVGQLVCGPVGLWASWSVGQLICGQVDL